MATSESLQAHYRDQLDRLGNVTARRMFGAACLFIDGIAFAIVDDGSLFLKTDPALKEAMKEAGGQPFTYRLQKKGEIEMGYCSPPESAFDDQDELLDWARKSVAIARLKKAAKTATKASATKASATKATATKAPATKKTATKAAATKKTKQQTATARPTLDWAKKPADGRPASTKKTATKARATKKTAAKKTATKATAAKKSTAKKSTAKMATKKTATKARTPR
jgi:TfoX/Sxy family transcriptional regulator of competence genes